MGDGIVSFELRFRVTQGGRHFYFVMDQPSRDSVTVKTEEQNRFLNVLVS